MRRIYLSVFVCLSPISASAAPRRADTYNAKCSYRCCDQNKKCVGNFFYLGGKTSRPKSCDWTAVCSKPGTLGWGWGGGSTEKNSVLTVEKGCWDRWEDAIGNSLKVEIKPCAAH